MAKKAPREAMEFGGPLGVAGFMIFSHVLVYYFWISATYYRGAVLAPTSFADLGPFLQRMAAHIRDGAAPTSSAAAIYLGFVGIELALAYTMPGPWAKGLPVPSEGGVRHRYHCNAATSWYVTLVLVAVLYLTGLFRITTF